MKESPVGVMMAGLLTVAVLGAAAAHPTYRYRPDPRPDRLSDEGKEVKRGFWDKRGTDTDYQEDPAPLQMWEKRGFGSMMPAYLVHLYRPDQPLLNPSLLFSRPPSERSKVSFGNQG